MSRARKQTCSLNHPAGTKSEKWDKQQWHRNFRRKCKIITRKIVQQDSGESEGKNDFPLVSEIIDPWQMGKDCAES